MNNLETFLMTDQPPTCPKCGVRVNIVEGEETDKQICLCQLCGFKYRLEADDGDTYE
jgi:hypothetical protein